MSSIRGAPEELGKSCNKIGSVWGLSFWHSSSDALSDWKGLCSGEALYFMDTDIGKSIKVKQFKNKE